MVQTQSVAPQARSTPADNLAAIDYTRVIMAFLVVAIHVPPLTSFSKLVNYGVTQYIARLGVPFFFFCNGYFLFRPNLSKEALKQNTFKQIKKLFEMYLVWTLIYMPIIVYGWLKSGDSLLKNCLRFVRNFVFTGSYNQLWYLPAAMLAIFLVWFAMDKGYSWRAILFAGGILYAVGLMYQSWYGLFRALPVWDVSFVYYPTKLFLKVIVTTRDGLFDGFLLVALGAYFAQHPLPTQKTCKAGFVISMAAGFIEAVVVKYFEICKGVDMCIFLPFAVTFLFCGVLQLPAKSAPDTKFLRKFSSLIFLVHYWFIFLYSPIEKRFATDLPLLGNSLFKYCAVALCSVVFALVVIRISEHRRFAWLKRFY